MPLDQPPSPVAERTDALRMTLGEHLEDLRRHMLWALGGVVVALGITVYFGFDLIAWLARPLLQAMEVKGYPPQAYAFDPTAGFTVYLKVTLIAAAVLAGPWIVYQVWRFVVLGLHEHERKLVHVLWPFSAIMTTAGVLFTYYVLLPVCLMFFFGFASMYPPIETGEPGWMIRILMTPRTEQAAPAAPDAFDLRLPIYDSDPPQPIEGRLWIDRAERKVKMMLDGQVRVLALQPAQLLTPMPDVGQYVVFAAVLGLGVVVAFQLPVVMLVVGWTGLVDPKQVAKLRKYALFICFAAGTVLTPTDLLSMFVLAVPLYALFELGLLLMKRSFKPEGP